MNFRIIGTLALGFLTFGCDQLNQLKDMHKNTAEMNQTTKQMNNATGNMDKSTLQLLDSMTDMKNTMKEMIKTMQGMDQKMGGMNTTMQGMDEKMGGMNTTMQGMDGKMGTMARTMVGMNETMQGMNGQMAGMNETMQGMDGKMGTMSETMVSMSEVMKTMDDKMRGLTDKMSEMYESARTGISKFLRISAKDQLQKAQTITGKISAAAVFNEAFEVQLWTGKAEDTEHKRMVLADEGVQEFYREIQDFLPQDLSRTDVLSGDSKIQNLNTLAVTMSLTFSKQTEVLAAHSNLRKMTMFTLTESALRSKADLQSGAKKLAELPAYVRTVIHFEKQAVFMMKTRMNFLTVMALGHLSPIQERLFSIPTGYLKARFKTWNLDLSKINAMQKSEAARYLKLALDTQKLLKDIGEENQLQKDISEIIGNMQASETPETEELIKLLNSF